MKKPILVIFQDIDSEVSIELDDLLSPKTVQTILENLPIEVSIHRWGDELYTEQTKIAVEPENAKTRVTLFDVAYWPEGKALCLFFGPTPISKEGEILAYSPVNIVGKIIAHNNEEQDVLNKILDGSKAVFK
ncbi:cyclophilin-like fold protein [soil metagenome]